MTRTAAPRREARERALHLAYEREMRGAPLDRLLAELPVAPDAYAIALARGAERHEEEIDALLAELSERWAVARMPAIDRALLRIGIYELGWEHDVPTAVVINEAVELAKTYSTRDSGRFVNGLLSRVAARLRPASEPDDAP